MYDRWWSPCSDASLRDADAAVRPAGPREGAPSGGSSGHWQRTLSATLGPVQISQVSDVDLQGEIRTADLAVLRLARIASEAQSLVGKPEIVTSTACHSYQFLLMLRAECTLWQDGRVGVLKPGDFSLYDTSRAYQLTFAEPFEILVITCPKTLVGLHPESMRAVTALRFSGRSGLEAVVSAFLTEMADQMDSLRSLSGGRLANSAVDLILTAFSERLRESVAAVSHSRSSLLIHIVNFIDEQLGDPNLDPAAIAEAHHISKRYLHKLFDVDGTTVSSWIRYRRLEQCRRDLARPELKARAVSAIASRWGLVDPSSFSRLFRETFGASPQQYRSMHVDGNGDERASNGSHSEEQW